MPELEEKIFRRLLFLRHGCPGQALYGDDGEMQCSACLIDFKRDSALQIEHRFMDIALQKLALEKTSKLVKLTERALSLSEEDKLWIIQKLIESLEEKPNDSMG